MHSLLLGKRLIYLDGEKKMERVKKKAKFVKNGMRKPRFFFFTIIIVALCKNPNPIVIETLRKKKIN